METMKDIIQSSLLLALVIGGLLYISAFSLVYLKKAVPAMMPASIVYNTTVIDTFTEY